jgi:long-subunit fatty acid transport protein
VLDQTRPNRNCDVTDTGAPGPAADGIVANLDRQWTDSMSVRVGGTYFLTSAVQLMGSLLYDQNAVPDSTLDASFVDSDKLFVTLQSRFELGSGLAVSGRWMQVFNATRTTESPGFAPSPTRVPASFGTYKQSVGLFALAVDYQF